MKEFGGGRRGGTLGDKPLVLGLLDGIGEDVVGKDHLPEPECCLRARVLVWMPASRCT
jgi:hypothetical protein